MQFIIMGNGQYGGLDFYDGKFTGTEIILCADGGANYAYKLGWQPSAIVGDMDSIRPEVKKYFTDLGIPFKQLPCRKDETDTQAVLNLAVTMGAREITMLGSMGKRLDHTLANIYSGMALIRQGIKIRHLTPEYCLYLVHSEIEVIGEKGDLVSILALTDTAYAVTISGFEYPLQKVNLEKSNPFAVSNVLNDSKGIIAVQEGVLAVLHYHSSRSK